MPGIRRPLRHPPTLLNDPVSPGYHPPKEAAMTELLKKAFNEASKLSPDEQDELASLLLAELESERRWTSSFEKSQGALSRWGREALDEHHRGETEDLDPADL